MTPVLMLAAVAAAQVPLAAGVQVGVTATAPTAVSVDPATYDLAGIRLGMSEADLEAGMRTRGMTVRRRTRVVDFESTVRGALRARHDPAGKPDTGRSVLSDAELDDGKGGRVNLRMLGWPDGARVAEVTYTVPRGTSAAQWRELLVSKYGAPGSVSVGERFQATWCGRPRDCDYAPDRFRLRADVGANGGVITLAQPEGTRSRVGKAVEAEVNRRSRKGAPAL